MKVRAGVLVQPVSTEQLLALLPALAQAWRELGFEQGSYVDPDGRRRDGLRVERGGHPLPGVAYRVALLEVEPAGGRDGEVTELGIELLADDTEHLTVRITATEPGPLTVQAELRRPRCADQLRIDVAGSLGEGWLVGGHCSLHALVALDQIPSCGGRGGPQVAARAEHRHLRGAAHVSVRPKGEGWEVSVQVELRGRGWRRPVLGAVGAVARGRAHRGLSAFLEPLPELVEDLNRDLEDSVSEGDSAYARRVLHEALAHTARSVR